MKERFSAQDIREVAEEEINDEELYDEELYDDEEFLEEHVSGDQQYFIYNYEEEAIVGSEFEESLVGDGYVDFDNLEPFRIIYE